MPSSAGYARTSTPSSPGWAFPTHRSAAAGRHRRRTLTRTVKERSMLSSSPSKIHEPLVTGVSPRPTDRRQRQELRTTRRITDQPCTWPADVRALLHSSARDPGGPCRFFPPGGVPMRSTNPPETTRPTRPGAVVICDRCGDVNVDDAPCRCRTPYEQTEVRRRHRDAVARARAGRDRSSAGAGLNPAV